MISIEELADILNNEINEEFLITAMELLEDGDPPVDPEHPAMEVILDKIAEAINNMDLQSLPIEDDYA